MAKKSRFSIFLPGPGLEPGPLGCLAGTPLWHSSPGQSLPSHTHRHTRARSQLECFPQAPTLSYRDIKFLFLLSFTTVLLGQVWR